MLNMRQQTINVDRLALLQALQSGLAIHRAQHAELMVEYRLAVIKFMSGAARRARKGDFSNLVLRITAPQDHSQEYVDVIDMLTVSVDPTIQLDKETYKAYYRNEWLWTAGLEAASSLYKSVLGGKA